MFSATLKSPETLKLAAETVPVRVGDAEKTAFPVPVSSVSADLKFAELGVPKNVETFAANPDTPVLIGSPVASAKSKAGVLSDPPNDSDIPPNDTVLFANLSFAIDPAS